MSTNNNLEPILRLLAVMIAFFTVLLFLAEKLFPNDGQIFQVISGLLTGFSGALLMRIKPRSSSDGQANGSTNGVIPEVPQVSK